MVRSRWIKYLTFLLHISLISAMFSYVIVLVSWIVIVDIFHKNVLRFKKRGGMTVRGVMNLFLLNLIWFHVLHDVRPRHPQFSWCGRHHLVLTYLNNTTLMYQQFNKLIDFGVDMNKFCQCWAYVAQVSGICVGSLGKVREIFSVNSVATL